MPQYYTLEEAARVLGTTPDELKKMADRGDVRPFRDRGTMRFRAPEIDEMARRRGMASDTELQLGEAHKSRPVDSPAPKKVEDDVFDFELPPEGDDSVEIGQELHLAPGDSKKGPKSGPKSDKSKGG